MYSFSIMPIVETHTDDYVADVIDQYNRGISNCPLFKMSLVPEGNPTWDKTGDFMKLYRVYKEKLDKAGVPSGILVQSSLGHGYPITPAPFTRMLGFKTGETYNVYCPLDPGFIDHFCDNMRRMAMEHPKYIMLDDDFRLLVRPGEGCACPRHMKMLNDKLGTNYTRETLYEHIMSSPLNDPVSIAFADVQRQSLTELAKRYREAIDSVDPTIIGVNCTSGDECDAVTLTNPIFAGKGNPRIVRMANGTYSPESTKTFSDVMRNGAIRSAKLKKHGVEYVLAETDTVPFNRYSKSATYLHAQYTASLLEGAKGAKHWITRLTAYEPDSGKAFRDILAKNTKFYDRIAKLSDDIKWLGGASAYIEQNVHNFKGGNFRFFHKNTWISLAFERLGIPFYYTDEKAPVTLLEDDIVPDMTDDQIKTVLDGSVFMTAQAASELVKRGYGEYVGVEVREWDTIPSFCEKFVDSEKTVQTQINCKKLVVNNTNAEVLSYNVVMTDNKAVNYAPATVKLKRADGKITVVFCGTPECQFKYGTGFSFLNETRKAQLVGLLKEAGALPTYCVSDNELCMRAGALKTGGLLTAIYVLGYDPEIKPKLYLEKAPTKVTRLLSDGTEKELTVTSFDGGVYEIDTVIEPMNPAVMIIK